MALAVVAGWVWGCLVAGVGSILRAAGFMVLCLLMVWVYCTVWLVVLFRLLMFALGVVGGLVFWWLVNDCVACGLVVGGLVCCGGFRVVICFTCLWFMFGVLFDCVAWICICVLIC